MRSFGEERAMMAHVAERIAEFPGVVTFNGRGLRPAAASHTLHYEPPAPGGGRGLDAWTHLDLLPAARHLWREALPNCKLSSLESSVLGVRRHEDVPSWLIPSIYLDYVRTRDARRLRPVFEHNRYDILTMVCPGQLYAARMLAPTARATPRAAASREPRSRQVARGSMSAAGTRHAARGSMRAALRQHLPDDLRVKTLWRLGLVCKRQRAWPAAAKVWHPHRG